MAVGPSLRAQRSNPAPERGAAVRGWAARLRISAGLAQGDDLVLAAGIEKDASISDAMLEHEVKVLSKVVDARPRRQASRSTGTVPRSAGVQRVSPSLVPDSSSLSATAALDSGDEDLFL